MDLLRIFVLCMVGIVSGASTSSQMDAPQGPCPGVEYRTKFNIFSFFINVEEEIYCVDSDGNEVDCQLSCSQPLWDFKAILTVLILLTSVYCKLKPIWVSLSACTL